MKFRLIVSQDAADDIDRLEAWLLDKAPDVAARVGGILKDAILSLEDMPERGRAFGPGVRELNARLGGSRYVVRYVVRGRNVIVTRIFHGREWR